MMLTLFRKIGFAFRVGLKGFLFNLGAALVLGLAGWLHAVVFEQQVEMPIEILSVRLFASLMLTILIDIVLIPWTVLLSLVFYGRRLHYWVSWLLMMVASVLSLLLMVYISYQLPSFESEYTIPPPSLAEKAYLLFMGLIWLFLVVSLFAAAFFTSHNRFTPEVRHSGQ